MKTIHEFKEMQKTSALEIRTQKDEVKKTQREKKYAGILQCKLISAKKQYRLNHIAYSLLKGRLYEQIEQKTKEQNKLTDYDWETVEKIKNEYSQKDVCVSA